MATSGVTSFSVSRNDVINAALRVVQELSAGGSPTPEDYNNCNQALNILIKAWQPKGLPLWKVTEVIIPMVTGQTSYTLGPTGNIAIPRPLRITDALIRDVNNNDTTLSVISRAEYEMLGNKTSLSVPNSIYYDPQLTNGVLYVYGTPPDATRTIHIWVQSVIQDMVAPTDTFDFPQEWFQALKWGLADEIAMEYIQKEFMIQWINKKATTYCAEMFDWNVEQAPTSFSPQPDWGR